MDYSDFRQLTLIDTGILSFQTIKASEVMVSSSEWWRFIQFAEGSSGSRRRTCWHSWWRIVIATDAEAAARPLFRCNVSLGIPVMSVLPTPDEFQVAVVKSVKLIFESLKSVAQWSLTYTDDACEANQRPTTSGNVTGTDLVKPHRKVKRLLPWARELKKFKSGLYCW